MPITSNWAIVMLQQYLPFTVLKRYENQKASVIRYVATVLTVYGIETPKISVDNNPSGELQQYLPFTVLKPLKDFTWIFIHIGKVATVLTVYGIETLISRIVFRITILVVATVLTVYGIETIQIKYQKKSKIRVATVLTVYGIETILLSRLLVG